MYVNEAFEVKDVGEHELIDDTAATACPLQRGNRKSNTQ